eukprot:TCONS_00005869-protein
MTLKEANLALQKEHSHSNQNGEDSIKIGIENKAKSDSLFQDDDNEETGNDSVLRRHEDSPVEHGEYAYGDDSNQSNKRIIKVGRDQEEDKKSENDNDALLMDDLEQGLEVVDDLLYSHINDEVDKKRMSSNKRRTFNRQKTVVRESVIKRMESIGESKQKVETINDSESHFDERLDDENSMISQAANTEDSLKTPMIDDDQTQHGDSLEMQNACIRATLENQSVTSEDSLVKTHINRHYNSLKIQDTKADEQNRIEDSLDLPSFTRPGIITGRTTTLASCEEERRNINEEVDELSTDEESRFFTQEKDELSSDDNSDIEEENITNENVVNAEFRDFRNKIPRPHYLEKSPHTDEKVFDLTQSSPDNINKDVEREAVIENLVENANLLDFQIEESQPDENVDKSSKSYHAIQRRLVDEDVISKIDATQEELQCEPVILLFDDHLDSEDDRIIAKESLNLYPVKLQREKLVEKEDITAGQYLSSIDTSRKEQEIRQIFADPDLVSKAELQPLDQLTNNLSSEQEMYKNDFGNSQDQALVNGHSNSDQTESNNSRFMDKIFMHSRSVSFSDSESLELEVEICIDENDNENKSGDWIEKSIDADRPTSNATEMDGFYSEVEVIDHEQCNEVKTSSGKPHSIDINNNKRLELDDKSILKDQHQSDKQSSLNSKEAFKIEEDRSNRACGESPALSEVQPYTIKDEIQYSKYFNTDLANKET